MTKIVMRLVTRLTQQAVAYERLRMKRDELEDERNELHNKLISLNCNFESAKNAIANHQKGIDRLKEKNDKLNADVKSAAGLLRTIHTLGVLNNEDSKAVEDICERIGYPIQLSMEMPR